MTEQNNQKSISLVVEIDNVPDYLDPKDICNVFNDGDLGYLGEAFKQAISQVSNIEEEELDDMQMDIRPYTEYDKI